MIGWVPKVLVGFLDQIAGEDTRRTILADAGLDPEGTEFRLDRDVPDPACRKVIEAACARLGVTEAQAFALFAPYFLGAARAAFPGFFRGLLDAGASDITPEMLVAAAEAIANRVADDELNASYIIPSVFDPHVAADVASAVATWLNLLTGCVLRRPPGGVGGGLARLTHPGRPFSGGHADRSGRGASGCTAARCRSTRCSPSDT